MTEVYGQGGAPNEVPAQMPDGWKILAEGEEAVFSLLLGEGQSADAVEAMLDQVTEVNPHSDWYGGSMVAEHRGYEGQMRTVTYRGGVYRVESGPEDNFWATVNPPDDDEDDEDDGDEL